MKDFTTNYSTTISNACTHEYHGDVRETVVCLADVRQAALVQQDLLQDERGDRLGQLRPGLHDPETQRYDLRRQEERDHLLLVRLEQGTTRRISTEMPKF